MQRPGVLPVWGQNARDTVRQQGARIFPLLLFQEVRRSLNPHGGVDKAAVDYLHKLLSSENQDRIAAALRQYQAGEKNRVEDFNKALQKRIEAKQGEYDALMKNLSTGALPPAVVADFGEQMQTIKAEIVQLQETTPPTDFTVDQIKAWLEVLKASADEKAVHLLIERIEATPGETKTDFNMQSTLKSVLGEIGCGDRT